MNNILIIRSANFTTMDKLIKYVCDIEGNRDIFMLVQTKDLKQIEENYPQIKAIGIEGDFFDFKKYKKDIGLRGKIESIKFSRVYIPSSSIHFNRYEDIFLIVSNIDTMKYILFNNEGQTCVKKIDYKSMWKYKYLSGISYFLDSFKIIIRILKLYTIDYIYYKLIR